MGQLYHNFLECGAELAGEYMPDRRAVTMYCAFLAGCAYEPPEHLGVAHLVEETVDKGTENYPAEALNDAFDALGARRSSGTGRETVWFSCSFLPEFFERVVELYVEMFWRPQFPADNCAVAKRLALQELAALEDEPMEMLEKFARQRTLGPLLGRHPLGEARCLESVGREEIEAYWRRRFCPENLKIAIAGPVEPARAAEAIERAFPAAGDRRDPDSTIPQLQFQPGFEHHEKQLEQVYIAVSFRGTTRQSEDWPAEMLLGRSDGCLDLCRMMGVVVNDD